MSLEDKLAIEKKKRRNKRIAFTLFGIAGTIGAASLLQSAIPGHALPVTNQPPMPEPEPNPTPHEICDNGIDDDNDGYIDKEDSDCKPPPPPPPEPPKPWYYFFQQLPKIFIAYNKVSSHAVEFASMAGVFYAGLYLATRKNSKIREYSSFISLGFSSVFGVASEVIQNYTNDRHGTLDDIALNIGLSNVPVLIGVALQAAPYAIRYAKARLKS